MSMTGPHRLLTLVAGFLAIYLTMLVMVFVTPQLAWYWLSGLWSCFGLYLTAFITGGCKGWWERG